MIQLLWISLLWITRKTDLDMALDIRFYLMCNKFGFQCFCFLKQGPKFCYRIDFWSMTTIQIILSFCTLTSSQFCWFKVGNVLSFYNHDDIFRLYTKKDRLLFGYLLYSFFRMTSLLSKLQYLPLEIPSTHLNFVNIPLGGYG